MNLISRVYDLRKQMIEHRRYLHQHPELAFQELQTAAFIARELETLGYSTHTGIGQSGVTGELQGDSPGPTILIRADMDALPIEESNKVPYASQNPGAMHACGHDGHIAISLAVARILADLKPDMSGRVLLLFQPAEEIGAGARAVLDDGFLDQHAPDAALGLHLWNAIPTGKVAVAPGPVMASYDEWRCTVYGSGGHGAEPQTVHDPITALLHILSAFQSLRPMEIDPQQPLTLTIGEISAGSAANIIPDNAFARGSMRSWSADVRQKMTARMQSVSSNIAAAMQCSAALEVTPGSPALVNDPDISRSVEQAASNVIGAENIIHDHRTMLSDDFSRILQQVPGCYFFVGSRNEALGLDKPHHSTFFDFDEDALVIGAAVLVETAMSFLIAGNQDDSTGYRQSYPAE